MIENGSKSSYFDNPGILPGVYHDWFKTFFFQIWGIHFKVSLFFGGRNDEPRSLRKISLFTDIARTVSNWRFVCFNLFPFLSVNTTRKHAFLINCTFVLFLTAEISREESLSGPIVGRTRKSLWAVERSKNTEVISHLFSRFALDLGGHRCLSSVNLNCPV